MPHLRLLLWITVGLAGVVIGAAILIVLSGLFWIISHLLPSWLIGGIVFLLLVLISVLFIKHRESWWQSLQRRYYLKNKQAKAGESILSNRRQAAEQSLASIDRLIERLHDDVARKGIARERERVAHELARGDLIIAVFGTGSSGKTSLIRALLNEIVGEVGAPMGSTRKSQTYRLRLKEFDRGVQLTDTPGILEAGTKGLNREKEAKEQASFADLILVVIDNDLRAAELETIQSLSKLGKKIILALNKCDLRGLEEEKRLIAVLRARCKNLLTPEDVLAVSASPQSIPRPGLNPLQPQPEIGALLRRLASVVHADGDELLADNILLQCRSLGDKGRKLLNRQRQKEARLCIDRYSWISGGVVAANPLPAVDLLGTAAVNAQMVMEIARVYGVRLNRARAQELAVSVGRTLAGLGIVKGGVSLISVALRLSLPTFLLSQAVQGVAAAWLTRVAGASFITYFQQDQDWGDGGVQEVVQHHYQLNKREESLEQFLTTAFRRVVQPLQKEDRLRELPPRHRPLEEEGAWDLENPRK